MTSLKNLVTVGFLATSALLAGCESADENGTSQAAIETGKPAAGAEAIVGSYVGTIQGFKDSCTTEFYLDPKGALAGRYIQILQGVEYPGELSKLVFDAKTLTVDGNWTDEFGTGTVHFVFASDHQSFEGDYDGYGGWTGTRKPIPTDDPPTK